MSECYLKNKLMEAKNGSMIWNYHCPECDETHVGWIPQEVVNTISEIVQIESNFIAGRILGIYFSKFRSENKDE